MALEKAKENSKEQYEAMKERIQFMYERGNAAYLELFFSAESFGDFLNKTEYVEKLTEYDRQMLENYVSLQEQIAKDEQALIDEKDALDVLREEALKKKEEISKGITFSFYELYRCARCLLYTYDSADE